MRKHLMSSKLWHYRLKSLLISTVLMLTAVSPLIISIGPKAGATPSPGSWSAGRIIDDSVFFNPGTMSSSQIQDFLISKEPSCAGNCMKNFTQTIPSKAADKYCGAINGGANFNAATIIKLVTAACSINPQAMLVLLQKEQGLVTDSAPSSGKYQIAAGYGCPDSQTVCDSEYYGFFNQVYNAARQFQVYAKNPDIFNFAAGRTSNVQYNPNSGCGASSVTMQNAATAGLYNYTPYQPNQAALNAGYSTGDSCSAYGNRNFWLYFSDWFGNPIGSEYAWLIESLSYSNGDNILTKGYTETITLKARNVGRQPWYNHGEHPIRLGTYRPEDRTSSILPKRPATMQESSVNINEVGTFQFQINPQTEGTFVEALNLVAENYTWMSWPGFSPTIIVTSNPYQWRVNSVSYGNGTGVMDPDGTQSMVVWATNTGNATWNKTSPPVWLATWPPDRDSGVSVSSGGKWPTAKRITPFNETSVPPGSQASFQFSVKVPSNGNYFERLNLVAEGQNWFNDAGLTLYLRGKNYSWQPVWQALSTGNENIGRGQTFDVTIKARNTGETTWYKSSSYPVKMGTSRPLSRSSAFYFAPSWLSDSRPALLQENSVPPGSDGTFTFTAKAPMTPGLRCEYFTPVAEGYQWLNDTGMCIKINVL